MAIQKNLTSFKLSSRALEEAKYWKRNDPKVLAKIEKLIKAIMADPTSGIGKPEQLKYELEGCWSRRINYGDRLVYFIDGKVLNIISMRHHY